MHRQTVGIVDLSIAQRLAWELEFVAGGEQRDADFAHHANFRDAQRSQHR